MTDLGKRIDLHTHSLLSDGMLLPSECLRYAAMLGHKALAITDHVDYSNMESVIRKLLSFDKKQAHSIPVKFIPGVEITHVDPSVIPQMAKDARKYGAKIVVLHGGTPSEPVTPGTNHVGVFKKGLIDILAHPGMISEEDVALAKENGIYLELSAKPAHRDTNKHVAALASRIGAKLLVNTDSHGPDGYISQQRAFEIAKECGLNDDQALRTVKDNPEELLKKLK